MADPNLVPVGLTVRSVLENQLLDGCTDRQAIADYTRAVGFEYRAKGFAIGLFIGAAACVALTIYVKSKGG